MCHARDYDSSNVTVELDFDNANLVDRRNHRYLSGTASVQANKKVPRSVDSVGMKIRISMRPSSLKWESGKASYAKDAVDGFDGTKSCSKLPMVLCGFTGNFIL